MIGQMLKTCFRHCHDEVAPTRAHFRSCSGVSCRQAAGARSRAHVEHVRLSRRSPCRGEAIAGAMIFSETFSGVGRSTASHVPGRSTSRGQTVGVSVASTIPGHMHTL